jgi:SAM-dependent methyltransferase
MEGYGQTHGRLLEDFAAFQLRVQTSPMIADAVSRAAVPEDEAHRIIATYCGEAAATLAFVAPRLREGMRVLEVGSGIGLVTRFLREKGVDIIGVEPSASGFGFMREISAAVLKVEPPAPEVCVVPIGAEALNPPDHGQFDLVFSANVMEHVADLDGAFRGMAAVLKPAGEMVHHCPNYFLPYEPHFGIPLVPVFPRLTRLIYPRVLTRYPGMWQELNFITAGHVRRLSRRHGLDVRFERGVLAKMLRRFDEDEVFRGRQGGPAVMISGAIKLLGARRLVENIPGEFLSPMVMQLTHAANRSGGRSRKVVSQ